MRLAIVVGLLAAACAPTPTAPTAAPQKAPAQPTTAPKDKETAKPATRTKVVAMELTPTPDPTLSYNDLAKELGLFEKNGIDIEIKRAGGGGPAKVQALVAGEADVAVSDIIAAFSAAYEGTDVRVIFVPSARYGAAIAAKKKYTSPEQLKDQQVGVPSLGGSARFLAILAFKHFGLKNSDIKWLAVGGTAEALPALFTGRTEAAVLTPIAIPLIQGPDAADTHVLVDNTAKYTPPFPNFVIIARNKWLQENPEAAERYVATMLEMSRRLSKEQETYATTANKLYSQLAKEDAAKLWTSFTENGFWAENGGINYAGTQPVLDLFFEIRNDRPNDKLGKAADVFNTAPLKKVLDQQKTITTSKDEPDWYKP